MISKHLFWRFWICEPCWTNRYFDYHFQQDGWEVTLFKWTFIYDVHWLKHDRHMQHPHDQKNSRERANASIR